MSRDDPRAHIILVNYRSIDNVRARLESAALNGCDAVVVDNCSEPEAVQRLCEQHGATPVLLPTNTGFAGGVNAAWRALESRVTAPVLLLNPDVELTSAVLDNLLVALSASAATGVAPVLMEPSGRIQVGSAGGALSLRSVTTYFLGLSHLLPRATGLFFTRYQCHRSRDATWLCMACLLLQPSALEEYGPIPEDELVYGEDVAWGTMAHEAGASFRLLGDVRVTHDHGSSGASGEWRGALERLLRRRLVGVRGPLAVVVLGTGLGARRGVRTLWNRIHRKETASSPSRGN